ELSSFNMYTNGDPSIGDPIDYKETYYNLQGFQRTGTSWINPATNQPSKYPFSGDPVTSTGWLQTSGGDRRSLTTLGPLNMAPGDTQSVIFAQLIGRGTSNTNSVAVLRNMSNYVRGVYANNFQEVLSVKNISSEVPGGFLLQQNFPNPFNPSTVIRYSITKSHFITLKVYDVLGNEISTLVNEKQNIGSYEVEFEGSNLSSGIYFYKLETEGFTDTKRMILVK
ncbi:MAG: T9SS type A sorting domain-containing protein, partial [bacterium]